MTDANKKYENFFKNYGGSVSPQDAKDALYDTQIKNISLPIATIIRTSTEGTILDLGYGKGIILKRLIEIKEFKNQSGWIYLGADVDESHKGLKHLAVDLNIDSRVHVISLGNLYENWISNKKFPLPIFTIIRNVFHELDIDSTAELIFALVSNLSNKDTVIIQDLILFPEAERGKVCWQTEFFEGMFNNCGFDCIFVEEPTKRGSLGLHLRQILRVLYP